jgi:hypothetical protein
VLRIDGKFCLLCLKLAGSGVVVENSLYGLRTVSSLYALEGSLTVNNYYFGGLLVCYPMLTFGLLALRSLSLKSTS